MDIEPFAFDRVHALPEDGYGQKERRVIKPRLVAISQGFVKLSFLLDFTFPLLRSLGNISLEERSRSKR